MKNESLFDVSESYIRQLKQHRKDLGLDSERNQKLKQGLTIGLGIVSLVGAGIYLLRLPRLPENTKDQYEQAG
jgi:hypothetical protein